MIPNPTSHRIDPLSGGLTGATGHYSNKLSAMAGLYEDEVRFSQAVEQGGDAIVYKVSDCLLYTSPSPRDATLSRMPSSA